MPKFEVVVTRTITETASFTVSAKDAEAAEEKVRTKLEPSGDDVTEKDEKAARRYFENNPAEGTDNTTEFEYETEETS